MLIAAASKGWLGFSSCYTELSYALFMRSKNFLETNGIKLMKINYIKAATGIQNKIPNKKQNKLISYHYFLGVTILIIFFCFAKNPILNLLIISQNYRKPLTEDWIFYAYESKEKYASQIVKQKILIISGSNGLFGIDAKQIEASTGIPTVNFAVHAGLGIDYMLYRAKKILKPGDIVLIPLEFSLYHQRSDEQILENTLKNYIISYDHVYFDKLNFIDKLKVMVYPFGFNINDIKIIKEFLTKKSVFDKKAVFSQILERANTGNCYTGITLNRNGDETCNIGKSPTSDLKKLEKIDPALKEPIDVSDSLRDFCKFAKNNKITIIPLYPAALFYADYNTDNYKTYFSKINEFWSKEGILFKDSSNQSFLEEKMMFNTSYHPNDKGRNWRTKNIINILNNYL